MRPVNLGQPPPGATVEQKIEWCVHALKEIEDASREDTSSVVDQFTVTNVSETRSFDANATSVAEIGDVLGTLINDYKERSA